jgi:predicted TIM-barrel fold metal-dependent hydrolase
MDLNAVLVPDNDVAVRVTLDDVEAAAASTVSQMDDEGIDKGVLVVLSPAALDDPRAGEVLQRISGAGRLALSCAVDFRSERGAQQLETAASGGVKFLKFHPYLQRIEEADFARCVSLTTRAEAMGMSVMVCCSYGTRALGRHNGLHLAAAVSDSVSCPVVMSHAGGRQILDAMLVAAHAPNVYLETSFTLSYFMGSSVEADFAFAMRKLGSKRWVYGSDAPFFGMRESLDTFVDFLQRHEFSAAEMDDMLQGTAASLLD